MRGLHLEPRQPGVVLLELCPQLLDRELQLRLLGKVLLLLLLDPERQMLDLVLEPSNCRGHLLKPPERTVERREKHRS